MGNDASYTWMRAATMGAFGVGGRAELEFHTNTSTDTDFAKKEQRSALSLSLLEKHLQRVGASAGKRHVRST